MKKTYEKIEGMKLNERIVLGSSPLGTVTVRRTAKGALITNVYSGQTEKYYTNNIEGTFANLNSIGVMSFISDYAVKTRYSA